MEQEDTSHWPASATPTAGFGSSALSQFDQMASHHQFDDHTSDHTVINTNLNSFGSNSAGQDSPDDFYRNYGDSDRMTAQNGTTSTPSSAVRHNGYAGSSQRSGIPGALGEGSINVPKSGPLATGPPKPRQTSGSIQERMKMFEANKSSTPTPKVPIKIPMRNSSNNLNNSHDRQVGDTQQNPSTRPGDVTRIAQRRANSPQLSRATQRNRFVPEDQQSNNTLSSIARTQRSHSENRSMGRPGVAPAMAPPVPKASPQRPGTKAPKQPLFGEIIPSASNGDLKPGFGISDIRPRSTSEAGLQVPSGRERSASPSAWYRAGASSVESPAAALKVRSKSHGRSQSDVPGVNDGSLSHISRPMNSSKIPIRPRRLSMSSDSTSTQSTRASSPNPPRATSSLGNKRPEQRPFSPGGRAVTPTNNPARQVRSPGINAKKSGGVQAYIQEASPPKESPPLRTSRDRTSVATATTASSRNRAVDKPSHAADYRVGRTLVVDEKKVHPRSGPIDYGASRARIKEGMREKLEETKKRVAEEELRKAQDEKTEVTVVANEPQPTVEDVQDDVEPNSSLQSINLLERIPMQDGEDSPTLGIPGAFPASGTTNEEDDRRSIVSDMTEFDAEPQTEPPSNMCGATAAKNAERLSDNDSFQVMLDQATLEADEANSPNYQFSQFSGDRDSSEPFISTGMESLSPHAQVSTIPGHQPMFDSASGVHGDIPTITNVSQYRSYLDSRNGDSDSEARSDSTISPDNYLVRSNGLPRLQTLAVPPTLSDIVDTPATMFEENYEAIYEDIASTVPDVDHRYYLSGFGDYNQRTVDHLTEEAPFPTSEHRPSSDGPVVPPKPANYSPQRSPRAADVAVMGGPITSSRISVQSFGSQGLSTFPPLLNNPSQTPQSTPQTAPVSRDGNRTPTRFNSAQFDTPSGLNQINHHSSMYDMSFSRGSSTEINSSQRFYSRRSSAQNSLDGDTLASRSTQDQQRPSFDSSSMSLPEDEVKRLTQRLNVIKELVDTEALYLKDMHVFEEIYKGTADVCPSLNSKDVELLFRNIDEVVAFTTVFVDELKESCKPVYKPRIKDGYLQQKPRSRSTGQTTDNKPEVNDELDRMTTISDAISKNLDTMSMVYTKFLTRHGEAAARLNQLKSDPAVDCWLTECNVVAKDLTAAWDIDSLWVKPLQRITKLPLFLTQLAKMTPEDHPDHDGLRDILPKVMDIVNTVNAGATTSKVHPATTRKRKESTTQKSRMKIFDRIGSRTPKVDTHVAEDDEYETAIKQFHIDYVRLQVVLRDIESYLRIAAASVHQFLTYLASVELLVRCVPNTVATDGKWKGFSGDMGQLQTKYLQAHVDSCKARVTGPIEEVLGVCMKTQQAILKRKGCVPSHEKYVVYARLGKKIDDKLEKAEQEYQLINGNLKRDIPKFGKLARTLGQLCLGQFVSIMMVWYSDWQELMEDIFKHVNSSEERTPPQDFPQIQAEFDFKFQHVMHSLPARPYVPSQGLPDRRSRGSDADVGRHSITGADGDESRTPSFGSRNRGHSVHTDNTSATLVDGAAYYESPISTVTPEMPSYNTQDPRYNSRPGSGTPGNLESLSLSAYGTRPSTSRSQDSSQRRRGQNSASMRTSEGPSDESWFAPLNETFGVFNSALPMDDAPPQSITNSRTSSSRRQSRTLSYNREQGPRNFKTLYMAASLFEFHIEATKTEAGYPYLTYPAGDIFDVIAEKGELWLAKNNEDPTQRIGWIWSKHFARFASSPEDAMQNEDEAPEDFFR